MDEETKIAVHRLLVLAMDDTGGSQAAANFLMAWWNAKELGGFDLTELWLLDDLAARDARLVFAHVAAHQEYPTEVIDRAEIEALIHRWRPEATAAD